MPITYDPVTNTITITGFTESVPCTLDNLYTEDLLGSLQLLSPKVVAPPTEILRPNNAGTHQEWSNGVGQHDELTSDETDITYIYKTSSGSEKDTQELANTSLGTVASVEIKIRARAVNGGGAKENVYIMDKLGATERLFSIELDRTAFQEYTTGTYNTDPDGNPWTVANVNNLEAGVQVQTLGGGETIRVSEIWIIVTASAYQTSLNRPVRPADSGALKLTLVITNFTISGTVTLTGTDAMGDPQTEDVSITGNGSFVSTKSFASIDANGVSATGNYTLEITQPRWGVISKEFDYAFGVDAFIYIGDSWTETWFAEEVKQIIFGSTVYPFRVTDNGHLRLGRSVSDPLKLADRGCHIITTRAYSILTADANSYLELYATTITAKDGAWLRLDIDAIDLKMWMSSLDRAELTLNPSGDYFHNIFRLTMSSKTRAFTPVVEVARSSFNDFFIHSFTNAFYTQFGLTTEIKNVVMKNNTYVLNTATFNGTFYFINAESDSWAFNWGASGDGKAFRQYEFDAHCQDKDGNDLSGVSVVGEYISPYGQAFSETTDVNGDIPTQTVDRSWYERVTGDTEQLKTPLKVTYSKASYQTVVKYYDLEEKTKDAVVLHKAVAVFISLGMPVVNLKKTDPENKNVLVL